MIELTGMVPVDFDLGPAPAVGQTWDLNQTLDFAGHALVVQSVQMTQGRDQTIWLDFTFGGSPEIFAISSSGDRDNRSLRPASKGSTAESGQITYALSYDAVPTGKHRIDIGGITVLQAGPWELGWQPPVTEASRTSPTAQPQACLTEEKWQALRSQPAQPLPAGLGGQFLLEQNTGLLMPQIFLADLRSGQQQPIAVGALSSLSPDGSRAAYIESNGQSILIAGTHGESPQPLLGSTAMDYGPIWSPDGSWIAFTRANDGVYILHPDGSGARRITSANLQASAAGWTPDSRALFISLTGAAGNQLQSIDLDTGAVQSWLTIENMKGGLGSVSPDGRQVLYSEKLFGRPYLGTWAANLDGSGKRLLAALDTAATRATAWSPDGKWVALGVSEQKRDTSLETLVLLQPDSCQVVLPGLSGSATGWR
jgi:Tol biopolymer transport system component